MSFAETPKFPGAIASETDLHNYKNVVPSDTTGVTLALGIASTDVSATVNSGQGSKLPADNFVIVVDDENIFVTTRVGDVLTITRAYEGSTAAVHSAGADVKAVITAKGHNQIAAEVNAIQTQLGANLSNIVKASEIGAANGVAGLDASGVVTPSQLPIELRTYNGNSIQKSGTVTTEQTLQTYSSFAAGELNIAGKGFHTIAGGFYSTGTTAPTLTFKLKLDNVILAEFDIALPTSAASWDWFVDLHTVVFSTGTAGTVRTTGFMSMATATQGSAKTQPIYQGNSVDLTVAHDLLLTVAFSTITGTPTISEEVLGVFRIGN